MTSRTKLWAGGGLLALALWETAASLLIVTVFGYGDAYPWPGKAWMWLRYLIHVALTGPGDPIADPIITRWLLLSGILAALPFLAIGGLVITQINKRRPLTPHQAVA